MLLIFILFFATSGQSAPVITSYDSGTGAIVGTGFGANTATPSWDSMEAGTTGAYYAKSGWTPSNTTEAIDAAVPRYSIAQAHSGTKSMLIDYNKDSGLNRYGGYITYDYGSAMAGIYLSYWVRTAWDGVHGGQWKMFRLSTQPSPTDITPEFVASCGSYSGAIIMDRPISTTCQWHWWNGSSVITNNPAVDYYIGDANAPGPPSHNNKWMRVEVYMVPSGQGTYDGTFIYRIHETGVSIRTGISYSGNLMTYGPDQASRIRYFILGHYSGDGYSTMQVYWDDVFVQKGTQARVELGDASTWATCTHREIQPQSAWSDTGITAPLNAGSFADPTTGYIYVVNADGTYNSDGYPVTAPAPPVFSNDSSGTGSWQ
jgi:hypothetical protein